MLREKADAEDLTQEVFIQLFRKIDTYRGEAAFTTWLYRLTVNVVLMRLRKRTLVECSADIEDQDGQKSSSLREEFSDSCHALSGAIDRLDIERAMAELAPGFKHVFVLHDVQGYAHSEIARMLGVSQGTSKSQLHKARLRLRRVLRGSEAHRPQAPLGVISRVAGAPDTTAVMQEV
jgi:RNA polymerase sigma-70 factor (ECF subfamily)